MKLAAAKKSPAVELFWSLHRRFYKWSGGRIGSQLLGLPVLLLTTTGRKTGVSRTTALTYLPKGDSCIVIASYLGEPRHPSWYLNLQSSPKVEIQIGRRRIPMVARDAAGDERTELWDEVVAKVADYAEYQERTDRQIPVVILEPR
jgi:deazaflavin-dependent oxidoreductase (nitroreductase family)